MSDYYRTKSQMTALIFGGLVVIGSLIGFSYMFGEDKTHTEEGDRITTVDQVIEESNQMFEIHSKAFQKDALRKIFNHFTLEDFNDFYVAQHVNELNPSLIIDTDTNTYSFVQVRLRDGNLIIIGYFDDQSVFYPTLIRK